jgi:hypothetical protein
MISPHDGVAVLFGPLDHRRRVRIVTNKIAATDDAIVSPARVREHRL